MENISHKPPEQWDVPGKRLDHLDILDCPRVPNGVQVGELVFRHSGGTPTSITEKNFNDTRPYVLAYTNDFF